MRKLGNGFGSDSSALGAEVVRVWLRRLGLEGDLEWKMEVNGMKWGTGSAIGSGNGKWQMANCKAQIDQAACQDDCLLRNTDTVPVSV